jgi:hypothetical protein
MNCHRCGQELCTCRFYPADYLLLDWLWIRRGWKDQIGDIKYWIRSQHSALGPNPNICSSLEVDRI